MNKEVICFGIWIWKTLLKEDNLSKYFNKMNEGKEKNTWTLLISIFFSCAWIKFKLYELQDLSRKTIFFPSIGSEREIGFRFHVYSLDFNGSELRKTSSESRLNVLHLSIAARGISQSFCFPLINILFSVNTQEERLYLRGTYSKDTFIFPRIIHVLSKA